MARILYGVAGEGFGHATRSKVIINHLLKKHEVAIVSSNNAYRFLSKNFKNVYRIYGPNFVYGNNKVRIFKTLFHNIYGLSRFSYFSLKKMRRLTLDFKPDLVISDFEPFSAIFALIFRIPVISIEFINMSMITSPDSMPIRYIGDYYLSRAVVRLFILRSDYHLVTSFFDAEKRERKKNAYVFPPILSEGIVNAKVRKKNHILVYQTSPSNKEICYVIGKMNENFVVYGFNINKKAGYITYKRFDEKNFIRDLANCKAVISNGGVSLISEAIHFGKPVLSIPAKHQGEQILNAVHLKKAGYGEFCMSPNEVVIRNFLLNLNRYKNNLKEYKKKGNRRILNKMDFLIEKLTK